MLVSSNRQVQRQADASAVKDEFLAGISRGLAMATLEGPPQAPQEHWNMVQMNCDVDDDSALNELLPLFHQARPLLLYLHGYNSTPAACFERCDRLQSLYGLEIVRFSWSSKKHLLDDGFRSGFEAGMNSGLQQELARMFGSRQGLPPKKYPAPADPVAFDLENVTCSWWLLMALTGVRH